MDLPLPLIIACIVIILALIIFHLIISYKTENLENKKGDKLKDLSEWEKIKEYGNRINNKTRKK